MIVKTDKTRCSGCSACFAACPVGCITMRPDAEGFLYPVVDQEKCIGCGKCDRVCPVTEPSTAEAAPAAAWGANARDAALRERSSSGGVFTLLAKDVLESGGVVFGAALTEHCSKAEHIMAENAEQLSRLQGSKYVQSNLKDAFRQAKEKLENGYSVLFTGTPCQIAGLRAFLGRDYERLLSVAIICHGAPSPLVWERYVSHSEKKLGGKLREAFFRSKKTGWNHFGLHLVSESGKEQYLTAQKDAFMRLFLRNLSLRPSCYRCEAKSGSCAADLIIGDFWGVQNVLPDLADDMGTSLVLSFTEKGTAAAERVLFAMDTRKVSAETALEGNSAYYHSVRMPECRAVFFQDLLRDDFDTLAKHYVPIERRERIKMKLDEMNLLEFVCKLLNK